MSAQADAVRAELSRLRSDLAAAKNEFAKLRAAQLAETSESLVVAAVHADTVAQFAVSSLDELNRYSQLDELTGLPTRTLLLDRIEQAIAAAQRRGTRFGVVFLDLDGFKQINDSFGHATGDQILVTATDRLQSVVRESDTVGRLGGDEFVVLLPEIGQLNDLASVADKILVALAAPTPLTGDAGGLSASIGIAVFPEDGTHASALLSHADAAMYSSKKHGRGRYAFHSAAQPSLAPEPEQPPVEITRRTDVFAEHESHLKALRGANRQLLEAARSDQQMRAHAEAAHQRQIDFVAMAAHAMRTPLSAIKLTVAKLEREDPRPQTLQTRLAAIEQHSNHLARLIDDLLDGSLVGGGEFKLDCSAMSLDAVVDAAVESSGPALTPKQQTLHLRRAAAPATVVVDPMRVTQLFANLLRNASRRAPEGGNVRFSARVEGSEVVFVVADDGAPIGPEFLDRIFELYVLDKSPHFDDAGLGIGLAVAQTIARAHGGTIVARNLAAGAGCEFVVTLPCAG